jgi:hypothetical protein
MAGMGVRGKHQDNKGSRTAKGTGGAGKHGGPTTGTGYTGGNKPGKIEVPGVIGKAASMAARILGKKK